MSKLGEVVSYTHTDKDRNVYPAIVTGFGEHGLRLTVFRHRGQMFFDDVPLGKIGKPGTWNPYLPESFDRLRAGMTDDMALVKTGDCGRCGHPARCHPEDGGRRCVEPGCGCGAWQQDDPARSITEASALGSVVFYRAKDSPQRYYPAFVTEVGAGSLRSLAVFTGEQVFFRADVEHGPRGELGTWRVEPLDHAVPGRIDLPGGPVEVAASLGRVCAECGVEVGGDHLKTCSQAEGTGTRVELPDPCDAYVVVVQMPEGTAHDDLAVAAEAAHEAERLAEADFVIAVWPSGGYRVVKGEFRTDVVVGATSAADSGTLAIAVMADGSTGRDIAPALRENGVSVADAETVIGVWPNGEFETVKDRDRREVVVVYGTPRIVQAGSPEDLASRFMARYGRQRQDITEALMVEWFDAARRGGQPGPRDPGVPTS